MWNIFLKFSACFSLFLTGANFYVSLPVTAAAPTGSLSCASSTSNSITIGLSYANTGAAAANLYRYGAPANGQIASYPGPSGSGRHVDTGLSGSYRYQLRTGTTILANVECVTKPVQAPAPAPAPAPAAPAPTPPPASAPSPTPAPAAPPSPPAVAPIERQSLPSEDEFAVEELPAAKPEQAEEEPIIVMPTNTDGPDNNASLISAGIVGALSLLAAGLYLLFARRRSKMNAHVNTTRGDIDALSVPSMLPTPVQNPAASAIPVQPPIEVPSPQTARFNRSIDKAFYPSRTAAATTLADDKAHEIPDMFTVANEHPESFGNPNYNSSAAYQSRPTDILSSQPPAGPSNEIKILR